MGLDMFLRAEKYFSSYSDADIRDKLEKVLNKKFQSCNINLECGYWRKANQIHNWFVENCQDGEDDCKEYEVSREELIELKEICEKVVKILSEQTRNEHDIYEDTTEIEELLPTKAGFFFGGYEYDENYLNDIIDTIRIINKCLEDFDESWNFSYRSSW